MAEANPVSTTTAADDLVAETITFDPADVAEITDEAPAEPVAEEITEDPPAAPAADDRKPGAFRRWLNRAGEIEELRAEIAEREATIAELREVLVTSAEIQENLAAELEQVTAANEERIADGLAEQVASVGFAPADLPEVAADPSVATARERYDAIEDPAERAAFYREHKFELLNGPLAAAG